MIIILKIRYKFLCGIILVVFFGGMNYFVYATDIETNTIDMEIYENWNELDEEQKEETIMPSTYSVSIPDEILDNRIISYKSFQEVKQSLFNLQKGVSENDIKFNLNSKISIEVKNQRSTEECWAFSTLTSMETNMKMIGGTSKDFSERHMDYATSESFYDGTNVNSFSRKTSDGGSSIIGLAYLTNGQGAVLEEQMPFKDDMNEISLNEINISPSYYVKGYEMLPSIYKSHKIDETVYSDGQNKTYTYDEVCQIRKLIKQHIINYGGIMSYIASYSEYYSDSNNIMNSSAYYCDDMTKSVNHAITIVGWDDNYSRYNFTGKAQPKRDGAYLVLNSYSEQAFENGYMWISYEDVWIETMLYGIIETSKINYDGLYQHDYFGANIPISIGSSNSNSNFGYYANVYSRNKDITEILNEVAISTNQYASFEIYVNPENSDLNINKMIKVATTEILKPGYNTISISPIQLTGESFAIAVKHKAVDDKYYCMIEAQIDNTFYSKISAQKGDSRISLDGEKWIDLSDLGYVDYSGINIDLSKADVCIKAFTTYKNITSDSYNISKDNYITKIYHNTLINDFIKQISTFNLEYSFINKDGSVVNDYNSLIKTGMILKVNDVEYKLVVRGDLNGDGKVSLVDLSKHIAHYTGLRGFVLYGEYDKASDINLDGELSIIDVSQFLILYNKM